MNAATFSPRYSTILHSFTEGSLVGAGVPPEGGGLSPPPKDLWWREEIELCEYHVDLVLLQDQSNLTIGPDTEHYFPVHKLVHRGGEIRCSARPHGRASVEGEAERRRVPQHGGHRDHRHGRRDEGWRGGPRAQAAHRPAPRHVVQRGWGRGARGVVERGRRCRGAVGHSGGPGHGDGLRGSR